MKKPMLKKGLLLGLALVLVCFQPCAGQVSFEFGAKAGVNFSNIEIDVPGAGGQRRTAPAAGLTFAVDPRLRSYAFQAEFLYTEKGDQWNFFNVENSLNLSYLELPLILKLQSNLLGNTTASLYAGPAPALKLSEEVVDPTLEKDVTDVARRFDLGGTFGVEFGFGFDAVRLLLDIRFTPGFSSMKKGDYDLLSSESSNQVMSVMTGMSF